MDVLRVQDIEEKYQAENGEITALKNISFCVEKGEFISIVGPSGCGKSTLLSIISGLLKPTAGAVFVNEEKIVGISSHIGYMLQKDNLLDWRTIYSNVMFGLEIRNMMSVENKERVIQLLLFFAFMIPIDNLPSKHLSASSFHPRTRSSLWVRMRVLWDRTDAIYRDKTVLPLPVGN